MRRFIIDTDTASDDAVALVMALRHPDVQVEAITVVAGNVPVDQGVQNALYTAELCGKRVPVYRGAAAPMLRPLKTGQDTHGQDGMGDIGLPLSGRAPAPGHAVTALVETINRHAGEITLVTLGPLTNVAAALLCDPSLARKVRECVVMGGIWELPGNVTPVSEYNIWVDPEAAHIVFESGLPITMAGWDIAMAYTYFHPPDIAALRALGTPLARFCADIQKALIKRHIETNKGDGFDLPDPLAMAVALDRAVVTRSDRFYVAIETAGTWSRGMTVIDRWRTSGREPNAEVVQEASTERFLRLLYQSVRQE